jgi:hypothetical protein
MDVIQEAGSQKLNQVNGPEISVVLFRSQHLQKNRERMMLQSNPADLRRTLLQPHSTKYHTTAPAPGVRNLRQMRMMDPLVPSDSAVQAAV